MLRAPLAAGVIGFAGARKVGAGAIDVQLAPFARGFVTLLCTALDGKPISKSARLLLSTPGYTLGTVPGSAPPLIQKMVLYPGATDWWTTESDRADKPSGSRNGGAQPVWMERVESFVTLRTAAKGLAVYPLDGAGQRLAALSSADVAHVQGGYRIHLQAGGQQSAPWYEIVLQ